jgi:UDP-N-acetylmuramate dehydrogenase
VVTPGAAHRALAEALGPRATLLAPLGALTTYGVGGPAAVFVEVEVPADLDALRRALRDSELPLFVIGRGSNLLVADAGFDGVVIRLGAAFAALELPAAGDGSKGAAEHATDVLVRAGAALALPVLARRVADAGWSGLSWAVGVPGSVGGAVRMNAGGHGSDMASCLARYTWVDLRRDEGGTDGVARLDYAYRSSSVTASQLVLAAELRVAPGTVTTEQEAVTEIVRWRRAHQPGGSNAGSVFTNPENDAAGRLIEEAGLKGFRLGSAHVSEKHANFIQADKEGRADDVRALMEHVRAVVAERCGVTLHTEVRLLGFGDGKTGDVAGTGGRRAEDAPGAGRQP